MAGGGGAPGTWWVETRGAAPHPAGPRTPLIRESSSPDVSSVRLRTSGQFTRDSLPYYFYLSIYPSYLSIYVYICNNHLSIYLSSHPSIHLSIYLYLFMYISVTIIYVFIYLFI